MKNSSETFESGKIYHLYSRSIGNQELFLRDENYKFFLSRYSLYCDDFFETIAYCLIPNHFHFLVRIRENQQDLAIVKAFSNFLNGYAKAFNKSIDRNGGLFQRKFKRKVIDNENYLSRIILYIHLNPIKHGLVKKVNEWKYSSFESYCTNKTSKVSKELGLVWFGGIHEFLKIHDSLMDEYLLDEYSLEG
ncbi:transposase [Algoriphagus yeomjeoni]|uniref:transposase n=1 Tax=Algoriphagus yeomjeoni TaxID=291403 RepID=UPI003CE535CA